MNWVLLVAITAARSPGLMPSSDAAADANRNTRSVCSP